MANRLTSGAKKLGRDNREHQGKPRESDGAVNGPGVGRSPEAFVGPDRQFSARKKPVDLGTCRLPETAGSSQSRISKIVLVQITAASGEMDLLGHRDRSSQEARVSW